MAGANYSTESWAFTYLIVHLDVVEKTTFYFLYATLVSEIYLLLNITSDVLALK
jgi:hypothetical protein